MSSSSSSSSSSRMTLRTRRGRLLVGCSEMFPSNDGSLSFASRMFSSVFSTTSSTSNSPSIRSYLPSSIHGDLPRSTRPTYVLLVRISVMSFTITRPSAICARANTGGDGETAQNGGGEGARGRGERRPERSRSRRAGQGRVGRALRTWMIVRVFLWLGLLKSGMNDFQNVTLSPGFKVMSMPRAAKSAALRGASPNARASSETSPISFAASSEPSPMFECV